MCSLWWSEGHTRVKGGKRVAEFETSCYKMPREVPVHSTTKRENVKGRKTFLAELA